MIGIQKNKEYADTIDRLKTISYTNKEETDSLEKLIKEYEELNKKEKILKMLKKIIRLLEDYLRLKLN